MSITIPVSHVEQFSSNVHMLAEQQTSRLRQTVRMVDVTGESWAVERLGGIDAPNTVTTLHGDTPLNNTPHTRRWGFISDYDVADLLDKQSQVKLLIDPESRYTRRHAGTMGRGVDDSIIAALGGVAKQGKNGATDVALPAAQNIGAASVGMTVNKVLEAKERLDSAEVDEFIPRFMVASAKQITNMLNDTKVTSKDYNTVQALVEGKINDFLGFHWVRSERLPLVSTTRSCYAYAMDGVELGIADEPSSIAAPRPDKRHAMQIYTFGSWGATRVEDEMVIEVDCAE